MQADQYRDAAMIVAHPDDETLWAGGTVLSHPSWHWYIVSLCRGSDRDRAPRFGRALQDLSANGEIADLDDGPDQAPQDERRVQRLILDLLPDRHYDLILSHSPRGEYTRHRRHEEVGRAVITLWHAGRIAANELWLFAYEDGGKKYFPRPITGAPMRTLLPDPIWQRKYEIITRTYGFPPDGFEAQTTPVTEAFWRFTDPAAAWDWLQRGGARP